MAELDIDSGDEVGGILEGLSDKLPEANFSLDCSDEVNELLEGCPWFLPVSCCIISESFVPL